MAAFPSGPGLSQTLAVRILRVLEVSGVAASLTAAQQVQTVTVAAVLRIITTSALGPEATALQNLL